MRLPFYGLRTGILTQLIFLIVAAMILINVAMVKFSERDLLQAKMNMGRLLIYALEQTIRHHLENKKSSLIEISSDPQFKRQVNRLLDNAAFSEVVIIDRKRDPVFRAGLTSGDKEKALSNSREAMETGLFSTDFSGSTWGVLWFSKRDIMISAPLSLGDRSLGGVTISSSLIPLYQLLRDSEKVIFLYILLDTLILATAGIYLLSRIAVKPIHKLLRMTEEYHGGDFVPSLGETSRNEIGELSRSLSNMLQRLDENKKELKAHITSLEKANRELQKAQNEVIRSEKLASVGRLAAGIAHEIGNPIGIVLGYLGLIKKGDIGDEEKEDFLDRIESEITRINRIIRQLLDFSRPSGGKPEKTHAHELIRNTIHMLKPQPMMEDISIAFALEASCDTVYADSNQLQQVFLNIIMNAADFLAEKNISADGPSDKEIIIQSKNTDNYIELRFIDNGPGIPEEERDQIFDPFYTTKDPGKGTGLGLAVCYRIVEGLEGTIGIESEIGKGATIIIKLPNYGEEQR